MLNAMSRLYINLYIPDKPAMALHERISTEEGCQPYSLDHQ